MSPGTAWRIDRAGLDDLPQLALLFDAYRQFYEQPSDPPRAERFLRERLARGESLAWIAWQGGRGIGFCQCYPTFCSVEAAPIFALYDLFVEPGARGLGVAGGLMQAAEDEAREQGCARLDLSTARTNLPAQALYQSRGWQRDEIYLHFSRQVAPGS